MSVSPTPVIAPMKMREVLRMVSKPLSYGFFRTDDVPMATLSLSGLWLFLPRMPDRLAHISSIIACRRDRSELRHLSRGECPLGCALTYTKGYLSTTTHYQTNGAAASTTLAPLNTLLRIVKMRVSRTE